MKVLIVSGFLGAGKTSFIKALLNNNAEQFTILENDYANIGTDADDLSKIALDNIDIQEMSDGCICCSKKGDFASSILTISNTLDPNYLIIEPSGVAMLSNILANIKKVEYERIEILEPICIVDGQSINKYKKEFKDIYIDQIKTSNKIIISKLENSTLDIKNYICQEIKKINPSAELFIESFSNFNKLFWNTILDSKNNIANIYNEKKSEINFETISLDNVSLNSIGHFVLLLEDIIHFKYGNIIRGKGNISINDISLKFDLVDDKYSILISNDKNYSRLVFIGTNIDKNNLKNKFFTINKYNKIKAKL